MPFATGQTLRVSWYFKLGPFRAANTRTYRVLSVVNGGPAPNLLASKLLTDYLSLFTNVMSDTSSVQGLVIWSTAVPPVALEAAVPTSPTFGQRSAATLPPQVCGRLDFLGSAARPRNKGRLFAPFPTAADNESNGTPTADYHTRLGSLGARFLTATTAQDLGPLPPFPTRSVSVRACVLPSTTLLPNLIVAQAPRVLWSTQRRRATPPHNNFSPFG